MLQAPKMSFGFEVKSPSLECDMELEVEAAQWLLELNDKLAVLQQAYLRASIKVEKKALKTRCNELDAQTAQLSSVFRQHRSLSLDSEVEALSLECKVLLDCEAEASNVDAGITKAKLISVDGLHVPVNALTLAPLPTIEHAAASIRSPGAQRRSSIGSRAHVEYKSPTAPSETKAQTNVSQQASSDVENEARIVRHQARVAALKAEKARDACIAEHHTSGPLQMHHSPPAQPLHSPGYQSAFQSSQPSFAAESSVSLQRRFMSEESDHCDTMSMSIPRQVHSPSSLHDGNPSSDQAGIQYLHKLSKLEAAHLQFKTGLETHLSEAQQDLAALQRQHTQFGNHIELLQQSHTFTAGERCPYSPSSLYDGTCPSEQSDMMTQQQRYSPGGHHVVN